MKFIFSHIDTEVPEGYTLIDNRENKELDHRLYSEVAGIDLLLKKFKETEKQKAADKTGNTHQDFPPTWVQTNHYRRRMDTDCCNRTYVAQPFVLPCSVAQHYATCHFMDDLQLMCKAIGETYPSMNQISEQALNGNIFLPYNIVNCQYGQFMDWATFVITVLKKVADYMGNPTFDEMKEIISKREQPKSDGRNNDIAYQARIYSFLSERLSTIYWLAISKQIPVYPAKINLLQEGQKI